MIKKIETEVKTKKHILSMQKAHENFFWAFHDEEFIQAPFEKNYKVGDIVILTPMGIESNIIITSKEETTMSFPTAYNVREYDNISIKITGLKKCHLNNRCHLIEEKEQFIKKNYEKIFNEIFGKKSFKLGKKGFKYGFRTFHKNALNPTCVWTRIESNISPLTTDCGFKFDEIGKYRYCPHCGGSIVDKPLFHINVVDKYTEILQKIKDDLYRRETNLHRFTETLIFIEKVVANYSEILQIEKADVLKTFEKNRTSCRCWSADYYEESTIPFLDGKVSIYKNKEEFLAKIDLTKGFRCPSCKEVSQSETDCNSCGYKNYGFLNIGENHQFIFKDNWDGAIYKIFPPVCFEVVEDE